MESTRQKCYTADGMPALDNDGGKVISSYEFWPIWLVYLPVILQWLLLAIRYRSLSLPLIANPSIPLSGMVGSSKSDLLTLAISENNKTILPFITHEVVGDIDTQLDAIQQKLAQQQLSLPLVGKPDLGCRGAGVQLLNNQQELEQYLGSYPTNSVFMLQKLADWEPEVGVFYVRQPDSDKGEIISLALKYSPYLLGDGKHTLGELLAQDERAGQLQHLYKERHKDMLDVVIPEGEPYRLVFSASHCRGAIFRDGKQYISNSLRQKLDEILSQIPEFYYGRLDIKFRDIDSLEKGETLQVVEINAASSESLHIWDRKAELKEIWRALLYQYKTLFEIGHKNRQRGYTPPGIIALWRAWQHERKLVQQYPQTN